MERWLVQRQCRQQTPFCTAGQVASTPQSRECAALRLHLTRLLQEFPFLPPLPGLHFLSSTISSSTLSFDSQSCDGDVDVWLFIVAVPSLI